MADRPVSKQRAWSLRQIAAGRCFICGRRRRHFATMCDKCRRDVTGRARMHYQRWKVRREKARLAG